MPRSCRAVRFRTSTLFIALAVISALLLSACGGGDDEAATAGDGIPEGPIVIGAAVAESGVLEAYDTGPLHAVEAAVADINAEGGIDGHQLEVVVSDTTSDPARGGSAALDVIAQDAVVVVVSCDFDYGSGAAQAAASKGVLAISTCGASDKFNPDVLGPLVFTMANRAQDEGTVMAQWAYEEKGFRRGYLLENNSLSYGADKCQGMRDAFPEYEGAEIVGEGTYKEGETRFAAQISDIRRTNADFIFVCDGTDGGIPAVKQARAAGIDAAILGGASWDGDYWVDAVPNLSDFYFATYASVFGDDPRETINQLFARIGEETGRKPVTSFDLTGYALGEAVGLAIERSGSVEGEVLSEELEKFDGEPLILGPTTFNDTKHITPLRPMAIIEIQNGEPSFLEIYPSDA